jgi:DNA-binding protein HU-beta
MGKHTTKSGRFVRTTITKGDIIKAISNDLGFQRWASEEVVEHIFKTIKNSLISGQEVAIRGFGTFALVYREPRIIDSNFAQMSLPGRVIPKWIPSTGFRKAVIDAGLETKMEKKK